MKLLEVYRYGSFRFIQDNNFNSIRNNVEHCTYYDNTFMVAKTYSNIIF